MTAAPGITPEHIEQEFAAGNTRILCCPICGACIGTTNAAMICTDDDVALYLLVEKS